MTVIEESLVRSTRPPSPEGPAVAQSEPGVVHPDVVAPAVSSADREVWFRIIERYLELGAPKFSGSVDPLVADKWKEDVSKVLSLMGVDRVQKQRLAAFSLKGDASKWYKVYFSEGRASMGTLACDLITEARLSANWCRSTGRNGDRVV